ncbi:MAG TPA: alpha/beta fold hydrolase [Gemmataceae bacterium]|nr:alpha/beta fold hydrolase [Gemmataceae bacterium]
MRGLALRWLACSWAAGSLLLCGIASGHAAEPERVKFDTFDQVEIHGTYFAGDLGNKSPCALLLHPLGGSSREEGWDSLAKELQKKHFAVLLFDFRGHGESTAVGTNFWLLDRSNQTLRGYRPGKPKDQISYKDFTTPQNWLSLVNDIEAAKRFLDRKNDSGECNSANVVLVGAESSAALGAMWIAWEWNHTRRSNTFPPVAANRNLPEGQDIACAIWLSFSPHIAVDRTKITLHPDSWLAVAGREHKVPMCFLYGEHDSKAKTYALHVYDNILHAAKDKKLKLTVKVPIKDTKLAGRELLGKPSLNAEELIMTYVSKVLEERGSNPWIKRDVERTLLVRVPIEGYLR